MRLFCRKGAEILNRIKVCAVSFFNKHFVRWKFLNSMFVIPFCKDGKMYLHISQVCRDGTIVVKRTFLIEHLVDDNMENGEFILCKLKVSEVFAC